ncbi:MAG: hypothetical protein ACK5MV_11560 [Aminipila sp.]
MKTKKTLIILLAIVLTITCMPLTAMASESKGQVIQEIDILSDGYYITDPDGNVVPTIKFIVDENVLLKPGYSLNAKNNVWYNGNIMGFWASVSGASVTKLKLSTQLATSSGVFTSLGYFTATQGDWYGYLESQGMLNQYNCYYRLQFTNKSTSTMIIDSLTGEEFTP